jgi:hypothetical protein
MIQSKNLSLADDEVGSTGITQKTGLIFVDYTLTETGVHYSAVFTLYDDAGTPTTVLTAGSGTYFSITVTTDTKVNVYWDTNQIKVENKLGSEEEIFVTFYGSTENK